MCQPSYLSRNLETGFSGGHGPNGITYKPHPLHEDSESETASILAWTYQPSLVHMQFNLMKHAALFHSKQNFSDQGCQVHHLSMSEIPSTTRLAKKKCHLSLRYILSVPDIGVPSLGKSPFCESLARRDYLLHTCPHLF